MLRSFFIFETGDGLLQAADQRRPGASGRGSSGLRAAPTEREGRQRGTQWSQELAGTPQDAGLQPAENRRRR